MKPLKASPIQNIEAKKTSLIILILMCNLLIRPTMLILTQMIDDDDEDKDINIVGLFFKPHVDTWIASCSTTTHTQRKRERTHRPKVFFFQAM